MSPNSLGTTLFDAADPTYFGEREAIKLAFDETGQVVREQATVPGAHETFATAEPLGVLPKLHVPNTLQPGDHYYGQSFDVSALDVVGDIRLTGTRSEKPVSLPLRAGNTRPTAFAAPVVLGMMLIAAARARRRRPGAYHGWSAPGRSAFPAGLPQGRYGTVAAWHASKQP